MPSPPLTSAHVLPVTSAPTTRALRAQVRNGLVWEVKETLRYSRQRFDRLSHALDGVGPGVTNLQTKVSMYWLSAAV